MKNVLFLLLGVFLLVGEVKCIVKMLKCNWEPIGKAEVVYSLGVFTGAGVFIGYMDIKDK
tara:strand:- start:1134 stop:1313 length:180 start_codon:yes stop_codon:yes gene_type:complete